MEKKDHETINQHICHFNEKFSVGCGQGARSGRSALKRSLLGWHVLSECWNEKSTQVNSGGSVWASAWKNRCVCVRELGRTSSLELTSVAMLYCGCSINGDLWWKMLLLPLMVLFTSIKSMPRMPFFTAAGPAGTNLWRCGWSRVSNISFFFFFLHYFRGRPSIVHLSAHIWNHCLCVC